MSKLTTDASGRTINGVRVTRNGAEEVYSADIVVVACGALSSALLLLRSVNDTHPNGLANGSDQVGRNYMRHNQSILMALMKEPNETVFQKTLAVSDYYFGSDDWDYPLGLIQMCATSHGAQIRGEALPSWLEWMPKMPFEEMARHSMETDLAASFRSEIVSVEYQTRKTDNAVQRGAQFMAHRGQKLSLNLYGSLGLTTQKASRLQELCGR